MTDGTPVRVLLVEDNPGDARLVEILLSEIGFMASHTDTLEGVMEELVSWTAPRLRSRSGWLPPDSRPLGAVMSRE